ncbi:Brr1p Ecym_3478 [Eremothecium cymbalariae DBVPG|uniref:Pre-mRNA-splicing factor BRR1 n=1 Tax=Eremothecium cymbalariae (strain CBS 270.75 / DBVPG 7215 / KCTC 17166 / NRRL Y-17582) TaxID=931890 RepID=G8JS42_ERECY|nr:Hypothetical protein Ecym_3478 [Eremothecium cymbalariae DBVPG\
MSHTSGPLDPIFGQSRSFDCSGEEVNPDVVKYLEFVRNEALRTNATNSRQVAAGRKRVEISYEDDVPNLIDSELSDRAIELPFDVDEAIEWFKSLRHYAQSSSEPSQGYNKETLEFLLFSLKQYIDSKNDSGDEMKNLAELLKDVKPVKEIDSLELDEKWAQKLILRLTRRNFASLENLKLKINSVIPIPTRDKAWRVHIPLNEPTHEFFHRMSSQQLFELVRYMDENLTVELQSSNAVDYSQWLFYLLLHLPDHLTASGVSKVRSLAKKAREFVVNKNSNAPLLEFPSEMLHEELPTAQMTSVHLVLVVVSVIYGQRDLLRY